MENMMRQEKLFLSDFENLNAIHSSLKGRIPDWLCGKNSVSPTVLRIMMFLFFLAVGYVAASAGMDTENFSQKKLLAAFVSVSNFLLGFFLNQLFFVPRFFFKKRFVAFVLVNFLFMLESSAIQDFFVYWVQEKNGPLFESLFGKASIGNAFIILLIFLALTIIVSAFNVLFRLGGIHASDAYLKRVQENFYLQADLAFLKQQLSPHFLFNTLNNITALVDIDPKLAQKSMIQLSSVLRQILNESKEREVPLSQELDVLSKYCELEKLRFGDNMDFSLKTSVENPGTKIAPLLMMPLIENAMKYGVHPSNPCYISIDISEIQNKLICRVKNSVSPQTASTKVSSGIGLSNLKRRLNMCYPDKYAYTTNATEDSYTSELQIDLAEPVKVENFNPTVFR